MQVGTGVTFVLAGLGAFLFTLRTAFLTIHLHRRWIVSPLGAACALVAIVGSHALR